MSEEIKSTNREPNLIVFARQTFTPLQKDIFTLAVMQLESGLNVQPDLFKNKTVTVTIKMLSEVSAKKYTRLKAECRNLQIKQLEISNDEKEEFEFIIPFPIIKYRNGRIELTMLSEVAAAFLELKKGYSEYYIRESLSLEQFNKKRLYELLSSFKKRNFPTWKVYDDELKFLLGMEEKKYKGRHTQFEEEVVAICTNAINEKTSIKTTYIRDKDEKGHYTVFTVKDKVVRIKSTDSAPDISIFSPERIDKNNRLSEKLKAIGMRTDRIKLIVENDTHHVDTWKWFSDNQDRIQNKKYTNPSGVLLVHLCIEEPKTQKASKKLSEK